VAVPEHKEKLRAVLEQLGWPDVVTSNQVVEKLQECATNPNERDQMEKIKFEAEFPALGYTVIRKPEHKEGRWFMKINEQWRELVIYGRTDRNDDRRLSGAREQFNAVRIKWTAIAVSAVPPPPPAGGP
jgi:hypothetical protein